MAETDKRNETGIQQNIRAAIKRHSKEAKKITATAAPAQRTIVINELARTIAGETGIDPGKIVPVLKAEI